ncbi:hypothetical protein L1887_30899 [Cichorium endivia]|nr:hypothetical protein L1887_30899 [Cichorium endivia]
MWLLLCTILSTCSFNPRALAILRLGHINVAILSGSRLKLALLFLLHLCFSSSHNASQGSPPVEVSVVTFGLVYFGTCVAGSDGDEWRAPSEKRRERLMRNCVENLVFD